MQYFAYNVISIMYNLISIIRSNSAYCISFLDSNVTQQSAAIPCFRRVVKPAASIHAEITTRWYCMVQQPTPHIKCRSYLFIALHSYLALKPVQIYNWLHNDHPAAKSPGRCCSSFPLWPELTLALAHWEQRAEAESNSTGFSAETRSLATESLFEIRLWSRQFTQLNKNQWRTKLSTPHEFYK